METILGIDGGGTKTTFLMVDASDREIASFQTGPSNVNSVGPQGSREAIVAGIARLPAPPDVVSAGFAGAGAAAGIEHYRAILRESLPSAEVIVESDAHVACVGALAGRPGLLLVAGTGSIVVGRTDSGATFRYGGWGPQFGDDGGGFWIGREAIRAALRFHDGGQDPDFTAFVADALGLAGIADLVPAWTAGEIGVPQVAGLAFHVINRYPDETSATILREASAHLRTLVEQASLRFGMQEAPVVATGSIAEHPVLRELIGLPFEPPSASPVRGAIQWARERIAPADPPVDPA